MNENNRGEDEFSAFDDFGDEFDIEDDPLKKFNEKFKNVDKNPVEVYISHHINKQDLGDDRFRIKKQILRRWVEHMEDYDRHVACANKRHAISYINKEIEKKNDLTYIQDQLNIFSTMFEYWSNLPNMPHGTGDSDGYNPVDAAYEFKKRELKAIESNKAEKKPQHQISIEEIAHILRGVKNILHRAVLVTQLKYGLRAGQLSNIHKSDLNINHAELNDLYPELGSHRRLNEFDEDVIYLTPTFERAGGKSRRPIIMPIDRELRRLLVKYLRHRPPIESPQIFINNSRGNQLSTRYLNEQVWKPTFQPAYAETEIYDSVTSHYARHRFATYWKKEVDANIELIKYMRGDKQDNLEKERTDVLDNYVHTYHSDIKDLYLNRIYRFNI